MTALSVIVFRAIGAYIILFVLTHIMGKQQISQLTFFDYVVGITLGTLAGTAVTDLSADFWVLVPAIVVFAFCQILTSYLSLKSPAFRRAFDGTPTVLIDNGNIMEKNLRKTRINANQLSSMLREKDAFSFGDVEFAVMETDGNLSVRKKSDKQPLTPFDIGINPPSTGLPKVVVTDGKINHGYLKDMGLSEAWLIARMAEQGVCNINSVALTQIDDEGHLLIDFKDPDGSEVTATLFAMLDRLHADFSRYEQQAEIEKNSMTYRECIAKIDKVKSLLQMYVTENLN